VAAAHRAGIRILMMTGGYGLTAEAIARRLGIVRGQSVRILAGQELERLDDRALLAAIAYWPPGWKDPNLYSDQVRGTARSSLR
jgi:magnesium-transporting ATPase (P-type)